MLQRTRYALDGERILSLAFFFHRLRLEPANAELRERLDKLLSDALECFEAFVAGRAPALSWREWHGYELVDTYAMEKRRDLGATLRVLQVDEKERREFVKWAQVWTMSNQSRGRRCC